MGLRGLWRCRLVCGREMDPEMRSEESRSEHQRDQQVEDVDSLCVCVFVTMSLVCRHESQSR
jgi:hypothetical protein